MIHLLKFHIKNIENPSIIDYCEMFFNDKEQTLQWIRYTDNYHNINRFILFQEKWYLLDHQDSLMREAIKQALQDKIKILKQSRFKNLLYEN